MRISAAYIVINPFGFHRISYKATDNKTFASLSLKVFHFASTPLKMNAYLEPIRPTYARTHTYRIAISCGI